MLKQRFALLSHALPTPAAFGRLCVETFIYLKIILRISPAAFGRLCVETGVAYVINVCDPPAAFGRLCVETIPTVQAIVCGVQPPSGGCVLKLLLENRQTIRQHTSRLRAAVC